MDYPNLGDVATSTGNTNRNVLQNISQVTGGLSNVSNSLPIKEFSRIGLTNLGNVNPVSKIPELPTTSEGQNFIDVSGSNDENIPRVDVSGTNNPPAPKGILPNELFEYSICNYHFTLSVLSKVEYNDNTYIDNTRVGAVILASSGAAKEEDLVTTKAGKLDFYLDNLKISGMAGLNENTGNTNALSISFRVFEPYSMGLFFQSLQTAAFGQGYLNYADTPMLLTIKFTGHYDPDNMMIESRISKKFLPLKIREINMTVDKKGCFYDVEAYPFNEGGFSDTYNSMKTDTQIIVDDNAPKNVEQLLRKSEKSLKHVVNQYYKNRVKKKDVVYFDEIDIVFPDESRDDESVNRLGLAGLGFNNYNKGETGFAEDNFVYEDGVYKRGKMKVNSNNGLYTFDQGQLITDIITQVLLTSDYVKWALKKENWTAQGQIRWWRIDVKTYFKGKEDPITGYAPKKIVYRVEEYLVDAAKISNANSKNPGLENKWNEVVKKYYYNYTGQNLDVIDLRLEFKNGFYRALTADMGKNSAGQQGVASATGGSNSEQVGEPDDPAQRGSSPDSHFAPDTIKPVLTKTKTANQGGAFQADDPATLAARQFQDLATTGYDMLNLTMNILGDPFYITSSGTGNYRSGFTDRQNVNQDEEMNYENGEVYVAVFFRNPVDQTPSWDIKEFNSLYDFGNEEVQFQFSGLFRVLQIVSNFSRGKFTQELTLVRVPNQDNPNVPEAKNVTPNNPTPNSDDTGVEQLSELEEADNAEFTGLGSSDVEWTESLEPTYEQETYAQELKDTDI